MSANPLLKKLKIGDRVSFSFIAMSVEVFLDCYSHGDAAPLIEAVGRVADPPYCGRVGVVITMAKGPDRQWNMKTRRDIKYVFVDDVTIEGSRNDV